MLAKNTLNLHFLKYMSINQMLLTHSSTCTPPLQALTICPLLLLISQMIFIVRRHGPGRRKGSTMNSTVTSSTWRGIGSVRLYFARDSQWMTRSNHTLSDQSPLGSTRTTPSAVHQDGYVKYATGAPSKIRGRDNITIGTWITRTLRPAGKLQELAHEMDRYR